MDSGFPTTRLTLTGIHHMQGNYGRSVEAMCQFFDLIGDSAGVAMVSDSFARGGWEGYLQAMAADPRVREQAFLGPAIFYAALGELQTAMDALEEGYESRALYVVGMNADPRLDPVRSEPRFQSLLRKMGFLE
jgi:hypothetical protein